MFIAALFTIARPWKQPKCPSTDEWIKMWHIYTMEYYSAIKRNETELFVVRWMDLESVIQSEVVQPPQSEWPSSKSLQITNAGEGVEKREPSYTVGGNVNWCSHYGEQYSMEVP